MVLLVNMIKMENKTIVCKNCEHDWDYSEDDVQVLPAAVVMAVHQSQTADKGRSHGSIQLLHRRHRTDNPVHSVPYLSSAG